MFSVIYINMSYLSCEKFRTVGGHRLTEVWETTRIWVCINLVVIRSRVIIGSPVTGCPVASPRSRPDYRPD